MTVLPAPTLKLKIGDHTVVEVPGDNKYMRVWNDICDPPYSWYKTYSSMRYHIEPHYDERDMVTHYHLMPVVGATVYTFANWGEIIPTTRDFTRRLLFGDGKKRTYIAGVAMYRAIAGPPLEHVLYPLPPYWQYDKDD